MASLRPVLILLLVSGYMSQCIVSCILPLSSGAQSRGSDQQSMLKKTALLIVSFFVCLPLDRERFQMFHFTTCLFCFPVCFPCWLLVNEQGRFKLTWEVEGGVLQGRHCCTSSSLHSGTWVQPRAVLSQEHYADGGWALKDVPPLPVSLIPDQRLHDPVMSQCKGCSERNTAVPLPPKPTRPRNWQN